MAREGLGPTTQFSEAFVRAEPSSEYFSRVVKRSGHGFTYINSLWVALVDSETVSKRTIWLVYQVGC